MGERKRGEEGGEEGGKENEGGKEREEDLQDRLRAWKHIPPMYSRHKYLGLCCAYTILLQRGGKKFLRDVM